MLHNNVQTQSKLRVWWLFVTCSRVLVLKQRAGLSIGWTMGASDPNGDSAKGPGHLLTVHRPQPYEWSLAFNICQVCQAHLDTQGSKHS